MIETLTEVLNAGLAAVVLAAWRGLPLLAVVLLIDLVWKHRIAPRFQCWLWMLVVARMLLPVSLESPISLSGPMDALANRVWNAFGPATTQAPWKQKYYFADGTTVASAVVGTEAMYSYQPPHSMIEGVIYLPPLADRPSPSTPPAGSFAAWLESLAACMTWTWAVVALFLISRSAYANMRFSRKVRRAHTIDDQQLMAELARTCQQLRIPRCPRVVELSSITVPAVFGWWKPVLCFPVQHAADLSPKELSWVLQHELAHVKNRDALLLTVASFMKAVHWFNPLAWIVDAKLKQVIEQAADAVVTREMSPTTVTEYGRVLLRYATAEYNVDHPRLVGLLSMASSSGLKSRLDALGRKHAQNWAVRLGMVIVLTIVVGAGLTDAASVPSEYRAYSDHAQPNFTHRQANPPQRQRVSIDVRSALAKAAELQPGIDAERFVASYFTAYWSPPQNPPTIANGILSADMSEFEVRRIKQRLRAFERSGPWQIAVECRLIEADLKLADSFAWNAPDVKLVVRDSNMPFEKALVGQLDRWDELLLDESGSNVLTAATSSEPTRPILAAKLTESQIRTLVIACQSDPRGQILQAPKVTCFNGQIISIASVVQRPFVTNVEVAPDSPNGPLAPTIDVIEEGWTARVIAEATEDGAVDLACILREANITDVELANLPIRAPTDPESDVIVQVPNVQRVSAGSQARLQVGESLAIAVPRTFRDHTERTRPPAMFYVFTPRLISDAEAMSSYVTK